MPELLPIPTLTVLLGGFVLLGVVSGRFTRSERLWLGVLLAGHVVAAWLQILLVYQVYGTGDFISYFNYGSFQADLMRESFGRWAPVSFELLLLGNPPYPGFTLFPGSAGGSLIALTAFQLYALGNSLHAVALVATFFSFFARLSLYRLLRDLVPEERRIGAFIACMAVPSVVFWTAGIIKEAWAIAGVCHAIVGLAPLVARKRWTTGRILQAGLGIGLVLLYKPYLLMPLAAGLGAWFAVARLKPRRGRLLAALRPAPVIGGGLLVLIGIFALGQLVPRFGFSGLGDELARLQEVGSYGGSAVEIGNPVERSLLGQLAFAPQALLTALFRPFLFEARSALMLVNGVETALVAALVGRALIRVRWARVPEWLLRRPWLLFSAIFTLVLALGVGLGTSNLGTLSRYRAPMMPMYALLLFELNSLRSRRFGRVRRRARAAAPPPDTPDDPDAPGDRSTPHAPDASDDRDASDRDAAPAPTDAVPAT